VRQQTEAARFSRRAAVPSVPAVMVQPAHHVSDSGHPFAWYRNVPLEYAAGLERVAVFSRSPYSGQTCERSNLAVKTVTARSTLHPKQS